jgi:hypothetical protein
MRGRNMSKTAYRFYWENGSSKSGNTELTVIVIATEFAEALKAFTTAYPEHPVKNIRNVEVLMDQVVVS